MQASGRESENTEKKRNFTGRTGRDAAYFPLYLSKDRKWGNQFMGESY